MQLPRSTIVHLAFFEFLRCFQEPLASRRRREAEARDTWADVICDRSRPVAMRCSPALFELGVCDRQDGRDMPAICIANERLAD
jgi:hypothetical protein